MCGINGFLTSKDNIDIRNTLEKMNNVIIHRGPDEDGFFCEKSNNLSIGMAMRRLSIIDLSSGKQPIYSNDKEKIIVFNGEIYNFRELKEDLIYKGYTFYTNSDTEVIINLYDYYGIESFSMLDGMFAFSLFDRKLQRLFIVRDFFGEKPLYYSKSADGFWWASELKSIISVLPQQPTISYAGLNLFFQLTYIPAPYTIYNEVHKLEANHYLNFDCKTYTFEICEIEQKFANMIIKSKRQAITTTQELVRKSVVSRSISDVPLGTFLSGGVDSSIISLCLAQNTDKKINTFSIGFEKKAFDETDKSQIVAKLINSNHHEFIIGEKDLAYDLETILMNFDEPFADSSALASYVVAEKTKKHVTVALTGDGGDEVFGGYNKYYIGKMNNRFTQIVPKRIHNWLLNNSESFLRITEDSRGIKFKVKRLLDAINYDGNFYLNIISLGFQSNELSSLFLEHAQKTETINYYKNKIGKNNATISDFRNIDRILSLEGDMLVKVDRASMLASLECRAPFLNKELWRFADQLPENYLINGWDKKHILKEAFKEYFPKGFLDKSKQGFGVPVGDWLKSNLKSELLSFIEVDFLEKQNLFQQDKVISLVKNHLDSRIDNTFKVWTFYCFQKWYRKFYE